jgi:hypothetical protein
VVAVETTSVNHRRESNPLTLNEFDTSQGDRKWRCRESNVDYVGVRLVQGLGLEANLVFAGRKRKKKDALRQFAEITQYP